MIRMAVQCCCVILILIGSPAWGQDQPQNIPESLHTSVDLAVGKVRPALVRIQVVATRYTEGRELKYEGSGSGVIISKDGYVVTNHHVAGHATRLLCTLTTREEIEAEVVGKDPLSDIALLKLLPDTPREFPMAVFGDSSTMKVGDYVLAMGSPMSLSQSVTLGIISNMEMVMPDWIRRDGDLQEDGEDVGSLVRWIAHDAQIYGGNSGGPLVNLNGEIIGINEISVAGLGGAIPGNLASKVAADLMAAGRVARAWLGMTAQPRLKSMTHETGVLVSGTMEGSPAEAAGLQDGDILIKVAGQPVDVQFTEQLPIFNQMVADLPIGQPTELVVRRADQETVLSVTPIEREKAAPPEHELREWGLTGRDISYLIAKQLKRDTQDGVLVTSIRPGGPASDAKPSIQQGDVIVGIGDRGIRNIDEMKAVTSEILAGDTKQKPTLVAYERSSERYLTVVKVGTKELGDPGLEVSKAWLPVKTQVLTKDIAESLGKPDLTGFRVTQVLGEGNQDGEGLQVGDYILKVDGEKLEATAPEDADDLPQLIRQYRIGDEVELEVMRGSEIRIVKVALPGSPKLSREMKRYRDNDFEFTVRDITFFDKADQKWKEELQGVLVEEVQNGGWASLALLQPGDLLLRINGANVVDIESAKALMARVHEEKPAAVVLQVLRGIQMIYLEIEPRWETAGSNEKE